jgi:hypothetical protein
VAFDDFHKVSLLEKRMCVVLQIPLNHWFDTKKLI